MKNSLEYLLKKIATRNWVNGIKKKSNQKEYKILTKIKHD